MYSSKWPVGFACDEASLPADRGGLFRSMISSGSRICCPLLHCPTHSRLATTAAGKLHRRAVFIDRDGVVVEDVGYLTKPSRLKLLPYAADGIRLLQDHFLVVIVTNQSAVARWLLSEEGLVSVHQALAAALYHNKGALVDAVYACPHHPTVGTPPYRAQCYCRKPQPGMMLQASEDFGIQLNASCAVGDKTSDLLAAQRAGVPVTVLVGSPNANVALQPIIRPTYISNDLYEAAQLILGHPVESI
jgi:D-glycero-D-manno-heptose 1,7-bisphosphate phosphatase